MLSVNRTGENIVSFFSQPVDDSNNYISDISSKLAQ